MDITMITLAEYSRRARSFALSHELDSKLDWYVSGRSQTRDSGDIARSNFRSAVRLLTAAGATFETVRFGHWGPGWIEHILVHPDSAQHAQEIEPGDEIVLDSDDLSEVQADDEYRAWRSYAQVAFLRAVVKEHNCERVCDLLTDDDLWALYRSSDVDIEHSEEGPNMRTDEAARRVKRDDVARLAWYRRLASRAAKLGLQAYDGTHLRSTAIVVISPADCSRELRDLSPRIARTYKSLKSARKALRALEGK